MTDRPKPPSPEELHAYVDGFLDSDREAEVTAHLAENSEDAAAVAAYRRQNELLRQALRAHDEPIPLAMKEILARGGRGGGSGFGNWRHMAAGLTLFAAGGLSGWLLHGQAAPVAPDKSIESSFSRAATDAHRLYTVEKRHPVEVAAAEAAHLKVWLSNRLGVPVWVPDLTQQGYDFIGGRLLPAYGRPAAQLMYQDAEKRRITCYLVAAEPGSGGGARFTEENGIGVLIWPSGPLTYAIIGEGDRASLESLAAAVDSQRSESREG